MNGRSRRASGRVPVRLRRRRAIRRARWTGWERKLGRNLFFACAALALIVAGGAGIRQGWRAYRDGRILTVNRIEIAGNNLWESSRLLQAAKLDVGTRVPEISLKTIRAAILQLPGIQGVAVHRTLGGDVRVEVREDRIVALRRLRAGWQGLTPSGAWIPLSRAGSAGDVPIVEGAGGVEAAALAEFLAGARERHPDLFGEFSQIVPRNRGEADIYWRSGRFKARVDYANKSLNSLEFLRELLRRESAGWAMVRTIDLRVEGYAYVF